MNENEKSRLLYDIAKHHGITKRCIGKIYIPRERPELVAPLLKRVAISVKDFFTLKPFN